jgi:hypothetical protein
MDLIFGIGNIAIGTMMSLVGFKAHNPFKGKNEPEKEEIWVKKFGAFFKVGGIGILIFGIIKILAYL